MKNTTAPLWIRFVAPSVLFLALVVLAFPVLEMGVQGAPQDFESWNKMREATRQPKAGLDGKVVVLTQSGLQSIWTGCSWGPEMAEEKAQQAKADPEVRRKFREQMKQRQKEFEDKARAMGATVTRTRTPKPGPAVLMIFYVLLLLTAGIIGCAMPSGVLRVGLFCGIVMAAACCLGLQLLLDFPFANIPPQEVTGMKRRLDGAPRFDHQTGQFEESDKIKVYVNRPPWKHMTWPILLAAMTFACLDLVFAFAPRKRGAGRSANPRGGEEEQRDRDRPRMRSRRD